MFLIQFICAFGVGRHEAEGVADLRWAAAGTTNEGIRASQAEGQKGSHCNQHR